MYAICWRKIQITILKLAYSLGKPTTVKLFTTMDGKNIYSVVLSCKMGTQLLMVAMICCFTILQGGTSRGKQGYIKMARDHNNMCCIACYAVYPLV